MGITAGYTESRRRPNYKREISTTLRACVQGFLDRFNLTPDSVIAGQSEEIRARIHDLINSLTYGPVASPTRGVERDGFESSEALLADLSLIKAEIDEYGGEIKMNGSQLNRAAGRCAEIGGDRVEVTREEMLIQIRHHPIGRALYAYMQERSVSSTFSLLIGLAYMSINNPGELFTAMGIRNIMGDTTSIPNRTVVDRQIGKIVDAVNRFARNNNLQTIRLVKEIRTDDTGRKTKRIMTLRLVSGTQFV